MFKDITLGQFYQADSVMHSLDPRTKLVGTFLYIIALFIANDAAAMAAAVVFLCIAIALSRVPASFMFRGMKGIALILLLTVGFNIFLTPGVPIWTWGPLKVTAEGLRSAAFLACRLVLLISGTSVMTLTTTPNSLTDAMESLLLPLTHIKVPVHEIALMMSIALRFIPILMEETDKIMKAQMARGADFESGNFMKRAKSMVPILVPLFVSAFRRASDLAMAMEARCYSGGEGRTKLKPLKYGRGDVVAYIVQIAFVAAVILL
ncbi:MAG: energy-coupling factor transporter transmembrane protein EcfT [Lachnospiraceae bacterium]|nr:energy-coupling factor transporter transmembrane protein EcfT [Lachnospiraceae bacterium]